MRTTILPTLLRWWPTRRRTPILRWNQLKCCNASLILFENLRIFIESLVLHIFYINIARHMHGSCRFCCFHCFTTLIVPGKQALIEHSCRSFMEVLVVLGLDKNDFGTVILIVEKMGCLPHTRHKTLMGLVDSCSSKSFWGKRQYWSVVCIDRLENQMHGLYLFLVVSLARI